MFSRGNSTITAMKFFTSTDEFPYVRGDVLDLAVTLDTNEYNGTTSVSVIIKAIKANADDTEEILKSQRVYEDFYMGNTPEKEKLLSITPNRDDFALLYRFLKASTGYGFPAQTLVHKLDNKLSFGKIRVILKAMSELGLIQICEGLRGTRIKMLEVAGKVQLETADIIKRLKEVSQ